MLYPALCRQSFHTIEADFREGVRTPFAVPVGCCHRFAGQGFAVIVDRRLRLPVDKEEIGVLPVRYRLSEALAFLLQLMQDEAAGVLVPCAPQSLASQVTVVVFRQRRVQVPEG